MELNASPSLATSKDVAEIVSLLDALACGKRGEPISRPAMRTFRVMGRARHPVAESLGLSSFEYQILVLLAAVRIDAKARARAAVLSDAATGELTEAAIHDILFADLGWGACARELAESGSLRRLLFIERSDGRDANVHEDRWTCAISRRVLAFLHGDMSI